MKKPSDSSFYIKGKVQFEKKYATGYVVNFYNKQLQLNNLLQESISKYNRRKDAIIPFQVDDIIKSTNVLRLEVQCHYNMLSKISKEYQFDNHEREFRDFINLDLCRDIIVGRYEWLIGDEDCDFYSYAASKRVIEGSDLGVRDKANLLQYILDVARGHNSRHENTVRRYRNMLRGLNIHWCFIPSKWGIDKLESPIKLLDKWVGQVMCNSENKDLRAQTAQLEAEYYNEQLTTPEDDNDVIISTE